MIIGIQIHVQRDFAFILIDHSSFCKVAVYVSFIQSFDLSDLEHREDRGELTFPDYLPSTFCPECTKIHCQITAPQTTFAVVFKRLQWEIKSTLLFHMGTGGPWQSVSICPHQGSSFSD